MTKKFAETEGEGEIICPYCQKENDIFHLPTDFEFEFKCEHCNKRMYVHVIFYAFADCSLNGEEHQYEKVESNIPHYECKICGDYKSIKE